VSDPKQRSVGDVPAPIDDVRFKRPKYAGADETRNDAEAERAAVVKYLRNHRLRYKASAYKGPENTEGLALIGILIDAIEKGEHHNGGAT
jgi:hypothetical protein